MRVLFLLFIVLPILEMWILISVGQQIGALSTIGLVLLTAFIGVSLLRYQGSLALLKARMKMDSGEIPAREMADGVFFAVGGALLLTPGFVTDAIGFACLTPGIRTLIISFFSRHVMSNMQFHKVNPTGFSGNNSPFGPGSKPDSNDVLEGEFSKEKK